MYKNLQIALDRIALAKESKSLFIDLSCLNLEIVPLELFELTNLWEIDLSFNQLDSIPKEILKLPLLKKLNLSNNSLFDIDYEYGKIYFINEINISNNNFYKIPEIIFNEGISFLYDNNPFLDNLPEEIVNYDLDTIKFYVDSLKENQLFDNLFEYKLLLVGAGEVGKTTLLKTLEKNNFKVLLGKEKQTLGINIKEINYNILFPFKKEYYNAKNELENLYFEDNFFDYEKKYDLLEDDLLEDDLLNNSLIKSNYIPLTDFWENLEEEDKFHFVFGTYPHENSNYFIEKEVKSNVWDFGGQEIYYNTHQFFLTRRSIYLLVWEPRKDNEYENFEYWLNVIKLLSDNSPVLVVMNKSDIKIKDIDKQYYFNHFNNIIDFFNISCLTKEGVPELIESLKKTIKSLPHLGDRLPYYWNKIRKDIKCIKEDFISYTEFITICKKNGKFENDNEIKIISQYLHDIGDIIHYNDDSVLRNIVILKPEWATKAVYRLFDIIELQRNNGNFCLNDLSRFWDSKIYPIESHFELIKLMERFDICFNLIGTSDFIIPELLQHKSPIFDKEKFEKDSLKLEYQYSFLPSGLINRLICRLGYLIQKNMIWKTGAIIEKEFSEALIYSNNIERKIHFKIIGLQKNDMLSILKNEINEVHKALNIKENINFSEKIACNCFECENNNESHYFKNETLKTFLQKGKTEITCEKSAEYINILDLYNGFKVKNPQKELIFSIIKAVVKFQGTSKNIINSEDSRNAYITNLLSQDKIIAKDQSRYGKSLNGINSGELDIKIEDNDSIVISIFEGLNLSYFDKTKLDSHILKTIFNYNPNGLKEVYIGIYYENKKFEEFCSKYFNYLESKREDKQFNFIKNIDVTNIYYKYGTQILVFKTVYKKEAEDKNDLTLYHIIINIDE